MSSTAYSAEISPDPRLRRVVLSTGAILGIAGAATILGLPVNLWIRLALSTGWLLASAFELQQLRNAWSGCRRLRLNSDGEVRVLDSAGRWLEGSLVSGGVLLGTIGWVRLRNHAGVTFGELLTGDSRASRDWRRLQVIWRHVGA